MCLIKPVNTFSLVDIWYPLGFSVSPPGQMIFLCVFITTCNSIGSSFRVNRGLNQLLCTICKHSGDDPILVSRCRHPLGQIDSSGSWGYYSGRTSCPRRHWTPRGLWGHLDTSMTSKPWHIGEIKPQAEDSVSCSLQNKWHWPPWKVHKNTFKYTEIPQHDCLFCVKQPSCLHHLSPLSSLSFYDICSGCYAVS